MASPELPNLPIESRSHEIHGPLLTTSAEQCVTEPKMPTKYVRGLSQRERIDMVLHELHEKHRWSIKDFVYNLVTAEPTKRYGMTCSARAKQLSNAIYKDEEVVKRLARASDDIHNFGEKGLVKRGRAELHALGKPDVGLGKFNPEAGVATLDISTLAKRVQNAAPELWRLLADFMEQQHASVRDTSTEYQGSIVMICSILAHAHAPRTCTNLPMLLGLHLHSMGVKRRSLNLLAGLGVISTYWSINKQRGELAELGKKQITHIAKAQRNEVIISWDNFDYSQNVRHQTLREPGKHISATTGKLCIGHCMPAGGLHRSMLRPEVALDPCDIYLADGNKEDEILRGCQRYWIAEAIRYTHREAVEQLFSNQNPTTTGRMRKLVVLADWPDLPSVERLPPRKTPHYGLGPILENEGTISGTYNVIDTIFTEQLGYNPAEDFGGRLHVVYGDQKTVSLIRTVQKERQEATLSYDKYDWLLAVPGLFHWRTNYMDMIHDTYSGSEHAAVESTLYHNKNYLGCVQGHKSPFHHKEEVATRAFDARVTAAFYHFLPPSVHPSKPYEVDGYIKKLGRAGFIRKLEEIRRYIFTYAEQSPDASKPVDIEFSAHAKFLQQMETYKTFKYAIKHADVGLIKRVLARCCLLFHGSDKSKYAFLSLYMTWLTQTDAATKELQDAILANGLVNLRGTYDSWFEMDRLNEFFNLHMKTLMATRRSSAIDTTELFRRTALTASYCTDLKVAMEAAFGEHSNARHQVKDASREVRNLAYQIAVSRSITKRARERKSPFQPDDILQRGVKLLNNGVKRFNHNIVEGGWENEEDLDHAKSTPIAALEEYTTIDDS